MPWNSDTAAAAGRKGGTTTAHRYGRDWMRHIGQRGFAVTCYTHYAGDARRLVNTLIARGLTAQEPLPPQGKGCRAARSKDGAWTTLDHIPDRLPDDWQPPTLYATEQNGQIVIIGQDLPY